MPAPAMALRDVTGLQLQEGQRAEGCSSASVQSYFPNWYFFAALRCYLVTSESQPGNHSENSGVYLQQGKWPGISQAGDTQPVQLYNRMRLTQYLFEV